MADVSPKGDVRFYITADDKYFTTTMKSADLQMRKLGRTATRTSRDFGRTWWSRFGKVAIGFTIAYRAMNLVEYALGAVKDQMLDTLRVIDEFNMSVLGVAAVITSFAETDDPFTTYANVLPKVKQMMKDLEFIAAKHLVTAEELRVTYTAFITKGVLAITEKDVKNVAIMADAVKLIEEKTGGIYQFQSGIYALLDAQTGRGRRLANLYKKMEPDLKKQIEAWQQMGKDLEGNNILLQQLTNMLPGIEAAEGDILAQLTTQTSTLRTYWDLIRRIGGEDTYKRIVADLTEINKSLIASEGPSERMLEVAEVWRSAMAIVYEIYQSLEIIISRIATSPDVAFLLQSIADVINFMQLAVGLGFAPYEHYGEIWKQYIEDMRRIHGIGGIPEEGREGIWPEMKPTPKDAKKTLATLRKFNQMKLKLMKESGMKELKILEERMRMEDALYAQQIAQADFTEEQKVELLELRLAAYDEKWRRVHGGMIEGMKQGWDSYQEKVEDTFANAEAMAENMAKGMEDTLATFLSHSMDKAHTFANFMQSIADALTKAVSRYVSQLIMAQALGGLSFLGIPIGKPTVPVIPGPRPTAPTTVLAPPTMHSGGIVGPRSRYRGLASDEVPAILQTGEEVLPRGASRGDTYNVTIQAVDAISFAELTKRNPGAIIQPIVRAREMGVRV